MPMLYTCNAHNNAHTNVTLYGSIASELQKSDCEFRKWIENKNYFSFVLNYLNLELAFIWPIKCTIGISSLSDFHCIDGKNEQETKCKQYRFEK